MSLFICYWNTSKLLRYYANSGIRHSWNSSLFNFKKLGKLIVVQEVSCFLWGVVIHYLLRRGHCWTLCWASRIQHTSSHCSLMFSSPHFSITAYPWDIFSLWNCYFDDSTWKKGLVPVMLQYFKEVQEFICSNNIWHIAFSTDVKGS